MLQADSTWLQQTYNMHAHSCQSKRCRTCLTVQAGTHANDASFSGCNIFITAFSKTARLRDVSLHLGHIMCCIWTLSA